MERINLKEQLIKQLHQDNQFNDDQDFGNIVQNFIYGDVYQHGHLELSERELILIAVNTTLQTPIALKNHIEAALVLNVEGKIIKEVIYHCTPYIGLAKVQEALEAANEIFKKHQIECNTSMATVNEQTRFNQGFEVQSQAFGKDNIQANHDNAPSDLKHIQNYLSAYCFGDFYTRQGLNLKWRELITLVCIASLGGCESQLKAHINANITVGNDREKLIEVITQCIPYIGFPRSLNAINCINEIIKEKEV